MSSKARFLVAALAAAVLAAPLAPAQAHGGERWDKHGWKEWKHHRHDRGFRRHYRHYDDVVVIREPRYVYRERYVYEPDYVYRPARPAVVISVPPLVIPF
jgi:Ni/Co efflux regulator RcnB